jgi:hypothetical protein
MVWMATIIQPMDFYEEFWTSPVTWARHPRSLDEVVVTRRPGLVWCAG